MTDLLQRNPTYLLITKMKIKTIVMFLFVLNITFMVLRIKCFSTILVFDICQSLKVQKTQVQNIKKVAIITTFIFYSMVKTSTRTKRFHKSAIQQYVT